MLLVVRLTCPMPDSGSQPDGYAERWCLAMFGIVLGQLIANATTCMLCGVLENAPHPEAETNDGLVVP